MIENDAGQFRSPEEEAAALEMSQDRKEGEDTVEKEKPRPFDATIVLGAGLDPGAPYYIGGDARMRVIAAAELYKQGRTKKLIFTGGKTNKELETTEAAQMKELAKSILLEDGFAEEEIENAIMLEDRATNTIENIANVCNIIDQNPQEFQSMAVLSNGYHIERAKELNRKFSLETEGIAAEDLMKDRGKHDQELEEFFSSPNFQKRLEGERRWSEGLKHGEEGGLARYWFPQAMVVESPDRLMAIMSMLYGPAFVQKIGRSALLKHRDTLRNISRAIPPEEWGKEPKSEDNQ